jgi:hypothetical protein
MDKLQVPSTKSQSPNHKLQTISNTQIPNSKHYDLEERTLMFEIWSLKLKYCLLFGI